MGRASQHRHKPCLDMGVTMTAAKIYIFDIDGTVADLSHRLYLKPGKHLPGGPKPDYKMFMDAMTHDTPIWPVIHVARALKEAGYYICFVTGRRASYSHETHAWFRKFQVPCDGLFMRAGGDRRPDYVCKKEIYLAEFAGLDVVGVFDDRAHVVEMWRELGLKVFQVDKGDY
jgi:hypothetical protein